MKNYVAVFAFGALTAFGAAGWLRSSIPVNVTPDHFVPPQEAALPAQSASFGTAPAVWSDAVPAQKPVARRVATRRYQDDEDRPILRERTSEQREQQRIEREERAREAADREYSAPRKRSTKEKIAIIGGGAAAGAAIGGMAGGGKGAAIGALAGGAGGYVYDKVTENRRRESATYRGSNSGVYDDRDDDKLGTLGKVGIGAAGGAAIGGMAGGGKGAAIGAAAGAAGGYVYDRVTRNR